jgi:hypothetical protein
MNGATTPTILAIVVQLGLGLAVFYANPRRKSNQSFLLLSLVIAAWLASLYLAFSAKNAFVAEFAIRQASVTAVLYLASLNLLRIAIRQEQQNWTELLRRCRLWLVLTTAIVLFCQTKIFLAGAQMPEQLGSAAPIAIYGPAIFHVRPIWIYGGYCALAFIALIILYWRDFRNTRGGERTEIAVILIGGVGMMAFSVLLALVLNAFVAQSRWMWVAPFRMIIFSLVIAYGIATRKIMDVGIFIRRILSYLLLGAYLLALYAIVWWLVLTVLQPSTASAGSIAHVAAAIVVAFAMAPARGISQRLAERLFISAHRQESREHFGISYNSPRPAQSIRQNSGRSC